MYSLGLASLRASGSGDNKPYLPNSKGKYRALVWQMLATYANFPSSAYAA